MSTLTETRALYVIANEIKADPAYASSAWCAGPYIDAMGSMVSINERYYEDSGPSVVMYALSNLSSWRGETARTIKAELKAMLKAARR